MLSKEITAEEFAEIRAEEARKLTLEEIALKLKNKGISVDDISEITQLSPDEIDSL